MNAKYRECAFANHSVQLVPDSLLPPPPSPPPPSPPPQGVTHLSRALTASLRPRDRPSLMRALRSTSFRASLMFMPCWGSPLEGEETVKGGGGQRRIIFADFKLQKIMGYSTPGLFHFSYANVGIYIARNSPVSFSANNSNNYQYTPHSSHTPD